MILILCIALVLGWAACCWLINDWLDHRHDAPTSAVGGQQPSQSPGA